MIAFDVLTAWGELAALAPAWSALVSRCHDATPFHAPEWLLAWGAELGADVRPCALVARAGRDLVGVAPLGTRQGDDGVLTWLGEGPSDYHGLVVDADHRDTFSAEVLGFVASGRARDRRWRRAELRQIRDGDAALTPAPRGLAASDEIAPDDVCPEVPLPASHAAFLAALPHRLGPRLERDRRRLARAGRAVFANVAAQGLDLCLDWFFALHARRWQDRGQPGVLAAPAIQRLHRRAAHAFASRGRLRMHTLCLDDRPLASFYGFQLHGRLYAYLAGFDPEFASFSPGRAIIGEAMRCAIEEGAVAFDYLRGSEAYKYDWGAVDRRNRRRDVRPAACL